jgi:hypothetical protein
MIIIGFSLLKVAIWLNLKIVEAKERRKHFEKLEE